MWSPYVSSSRVHLVQRVGGRLVRGIPRILRTARGKAAGGNGESWRRGWFGRGRRSHEREDGREARRRRSRAGAEVRSSV